jgi:membrane associated rhomboid family serine protease/DNA-directed RNA polymerase subunit RPC12/RpoP
MAGTPDLFVVCKNCKAEVSPYITECPYCGHRLRKRAPKLDRGAAPRRERVRGAPSPRLGRLRPRSPDDYPRRRGLPYVALALVVIPALVTLLGKAGLFDVLNIVLFAGVNGDWWRPITTQLYYGSTAYEVIALGSIFLFAWLLERRHGFWAPLLVAIVGGAAGIGLVLAADPKAFATGGNGIALALLAAWTMRDLVAARRGEEIESDLLGVAAIAVVIALLPAAVEEANPLLGAGGLIAGALLGIPLSRRR